jgi:hypothetical protein
MSRITPLLNERTLLRLTHAVASFAESRCAGASGAGRWYCPS